MTRAELLENAQAFLVWWRDELLACVPQRLRAIWVNHIPRALIHADGHATDITMMSGKTHSQYSDETMLRDLGATAWDDVAVLIAERRTVIALAAPLSFQRDMPLPRGSWSNARRVLELQLERIAPVTPDAVAWSWTAEARNGTMWATIAMARLSDIAAIDAACDPRAVATPTIAVPGPSGLIIVRQGKDGSLTAERRRDRRWMLVAFALLASIPFTGIAALAVARTSVSGDVAVLMEEVGPKLAQRARADQARRALSTLRPVLKQPALADIAERLARALPPSARVELLAIQDGGLVQADISGSDAGTLAEALTPKFSSVEVSDPVAAVPSVSPDITGPVAPNPSPTPSAQRIHVEIRP